MFLFDLHVTDLCEPLLITTSSPIILRVDTKNSIQLKEEKNVVVLILGNAIIQLMFAVWYVAL